MTLLLAALAAAAAGVSPVSSESAGGPAGGPGGTGLPPNLIVFLADDLGVDLAASYGLAPDPPCTPNLDQLASEGMLFRNAWVNPICAPTRAVLQTGRHAFRTGVGMPTMAPTLALAETTLPEMLTGYTSAYVGKWHLAGTQGDTHPNDSGYHRFAGLVGGAVQDYFAWPKVVDGVASTSTTYTTIDFADEAVAAIETLPEPWLVFVGFNAPHSPFHVPPPTLCPASACPSAACAGLPPGADDARLVKAAVEAMDTVIGRILTAQQAVAPNTYVFFLTDNGSPAAATEPPFVPSRAKGSLYEGGVHVPFLVRGPGVLAAECDALVSAVDLFATLGELAGVPAPTGVDSVSMVPYFADPTLSVRRWMYTERFGPNGATPPFPSHQRAIRSTRFKLIRRTDRPDELYDLLADPWETTNLLTSPLTPVAQQAYDGLVAELVLLGVP